MTGTIVRTVLAAMARAACRIAADDAGAAAFDYWAARWVPCKLGLGEAWPRQ